MKDPRPNIILITTDQQRGDCLGIEGHPVLQTPNIDWLARSGTHFRRGYSECPSCIPARRTLMSGQAPAVNGVVSMGTGGWEVEGWHPAHTLAGELSRAGYQTEMVGKLHLFPYRKRYGFDHLRLSDAPFQLGTYPENDYTDWLAEGGAVPVEAGMAHGVSCNGWVGRPHYLPEHKMHAFWCVDQALDFLNKRDPTAPFFLNVSFFDPHPPLTPPAFYYDRYITRDLPPPVVGDWVADIDAAFDEPQKGLHPDALRIKLDEATMRCARAGYYGLINFVDDQVGRLLNSLAAAGLLNNTFILFASDHGEMLGDHNLFRKTFAYEPSARVPFLARAAQTMEYPAEIVTAAPVGLQDIMPTLLDVAGIEIPEAVTGRSLLPLMRGEENGWREYLHGEHAGDYRYEDGMHYLTDGHHKYIWYSQTGHEQFFNLDEDPQELRDVARQDRVESLLAPWRQRLVSTLRDRPEGFSDGERLIVGRPHKAMVPAPNV